MWLVFALIGAVFKASTNYYRKKIAGNVRADVYLWFTYSVFLIVLLPFLFVGDSSVVDLFKEHTLLLIAAGLAPNVAVICNVEALKREDLSYIAPLNAFIPVVTLVIAWLALGESPPFVGAFGVLMVFVGAYIMNLRIGRVHWFEPVQHIFTNTGARFGFGMVVAFAVNAIIVKFLANDGYDAITIMYGSIVSGWMFLSYVPFKLGSQVLSAVDKHRAKLLAVTFSSLLGIFFGLLALERIYASYALSVRRLDILISIFLGWRVLNETNIRYKLIGGICMTLGVVVIALS